MCSLIKKQLLLAVYAYLFTMEQQKGQQGSEALQLEAQSQKSTIGRCTAELHVGEFCVGEPMISKQTTSASCPTNCKPVTKPDGFKGAYDIRIQDILSKPSALYLRYYGPDFQTAWRSPQQMELRTSRMALGLGLVDTKQVSAPLCEVTTGRTAVEQAPILKGKFGAHLRSTDDEAEFSHRLVPSAIPPTLRDVSPPECPKCPTFAEWAWSELYAETNSDKPKVMAMLEGYWDQASTMSPQGWIDDASKDRKEQDNRRDWVKEMASFKVAIWPGKLGRSEKDIRLKVKDLLLLQEPTRIQLEREVRLWLSDYPPCVFFRNIKRPDAPVGTDITTDVVHELVFGNRVVEYWKFVREDVKPGLDREYVDALIKHAAPLYYKELRPNNTLA